MRRFKDALLATVMAAVTALSFAGCSKPDPLMTGKTVVEYWRSASAEEASMVKDAIQWYNENNTDNIYILYRSKTSNGYGDLLNRTLSAGVKGPDLFDVGEAFVKSLINLGPDGVVENLQPYIDKDPEGLGSMDPATLSPYRYGRENMTVAADDPLYAFPTATNTGLLGYNATAMKRQGVTIISVDAEDIDAFNNGAPDNYGKTKEDYGIQGNVRARGFDRWDGFSEDKNYIKGTYSDDGKTFTPNTEQWQMPEYEVTNAAKKEFVCKEQMIFNNRIAMSWDEVEDLGRIMTKNPNSEYYPDNAAYAPSTDWGFYTRYWFAYGWGVGGAAIKDKTGEGDWEFTLGETDRYRLLLKQKGEEKDLLTDEVVVDGNGRPVFIPEDEAAGYELKEGEYLTDPLPSQYQAFDRFFHMQKPKRYDGLYIGPRQSADIGGGTELGFFTSQKMCMFGHLETTQVYSARKAIGNRFEWDVAPAPVYKAYNAEGELVNRGAEMFFLYNTTAVAMWNNSDEKEASYKVMKYLASGEYQRFQSEVGLRLSPVKEYNDKYYVPANLKDEDLQPRNIGLYADTLSMRFEDEASFFSDNYWVSYWANQLNSTYRENGDSFDDFLAAYTDGTVAEIQKLKDLLLNQ